MNVMDKEDSLIRLVHYVQNQVRHVMTSLPITAITTAGFYFSGFLFLASAFLLVAIYKFRWKSDFTSFCVWLVVYICAGLVTGLITHEFFAVFIVLGINLLLTLCLCKLIPVISLFGVFFLVSMLSPSLFGLIWLYELMSAASFTLQAGWPLYLLLVFLAVVLSVLVIVNTAMWSWIVLVRFSALYFPFPRLLKAWKMADAPKKVYPWISLHVPCFNEPPEIVMETLNALARLQYPHFEVIVLDNNTKDPNIWKPVEKHCLQLGERFRFHHIDSLSGAKAGALNACLQLTSPQMEFIGVLDADYVTKSDFLERLIGFFDDPKVGFVQACQDYREWEHNPYQSAFYFECETFFKLVLPGQSEWDAAYTIGTMCLLRRQVLGAVGGWAEWCLTEDSEVAVRIHALGYSGYYLKDTFGYGLIPETFESCKQQRFRWAAGPVQQFQKHWQLYLPWSHKGCLTLIQKFGEIYHSLATFFNEFMNMLINIPVLAVCLWFVVEKEHSFILPLALLLFIPIAIVRNVICNWLAIRLLGGNWKNYILSALATRSLIFTRNMAFYKASFGSDLKWTRTDKFKTSSSFWRAFYCSRSETIAALIYSVVAVFLAPFVNFQFPDLIFLIWLGIVNRAFTLFCSPIMAILSEKCLQKADKGQRT